MIAFCLLQVDLYLLIFAQSQWKNGHFYVDILVSSVGFNLDLIRSITGGQPSDRMQAFCWS